MGAATKVFKVEEDAPTSAEDAVYTAETKVGEGAYVAITKLMNLDHAEAHRTALHDHAPASSVQYKSGFVPRVTVDKNRETLPAPAEADDDDSLEPTSVIDAPWIPPQPPAVAIAIIDVPSTDMSIEVPIVVDNIPQVSPPPVALVPPTPAAPVIVDTRLREVIVFAVAFFTTLLPVVIYLLAR